jgi:aryl-alcohol dehydrogenase-like predicted oxidoreductase
MWEWSNYSRGVPAAKLAALPGELGADYPDVVTSYYVEHPAEWHDITGRGGAAEAIDETRGQGTVRAIGLTRHQRPLSAHAAQSGRLHLLMVRYNPAGSLP